MRYTVLLRTDAAGKRVLLADEDMELLAEEGTRWRLLMESDSHSTAIAALALANEQLERGEL